MLSVGPEVGHSDDTFGTVKLRFRVLSVLSHGSRGSEGLFLFDNI